MKHSIRIQAIRHATMLLTVEGKKILVDPMLSPKEAMEPSPHTTNQVRIPLVELPVGLELLQNIDAILLTHLHYDHFDQVAEKVLPKNLPVFCQPGDAQTLRKKGFTRTVPVAQSSQWEGLTLYRVDGNHGRGDVLKFMGDSSGFVIETSEGRTLYIGGDCIYDEQFEQNLDRFTPEIVILYGGEAKLNFGSNITMGSEDIRNVCVRSPGARAVVVHMEALNHCGLTRARLKGDLEEHGLLERVTIPEDGEIISL